jgi:hypothetical protein
MMQWSSPDFVEIKMDAEISSYQEDGDPTRDPTFARTRQPDAASASNKLAEARPID